MSRLDEIKARAEQVHWTSTSIEQAMARMASSAADVPWLVSEVERLTAECDAVAAAHARESEKVWKVEEVKELFEGSDPTAWERLRDALAGSEADTSDTQSTDPGCGCSTNPARARYADGDPAGCYRSGGPVMEVSPWT